MTKPFTFEEIYEQNRRRIHYQIHRLNLYDPHKEYFQEGLCAMWHAYETYDPDKGPMSTYFNYIIRHRLLDQLRKENKEQTRRNALLQTPHYLQLEPTEVPADDLELFNYLKNYVTEKQWLWLSHSILQGMSLKQIATHQATTTDAVKSWARQARKKLRTEEIRCLLQGNNEQEAFFSTKKGRA